MKTALHTSVFFKPAGSFIFIACAFVFCLFFTGSFLPHAQAHTNNLYAAGKDDTDSRTLTGDAAAQQTCRLLQEQAAQTLRAQLTGTPDNQDATLRGWVFAHGQTTFHQTLYGALNMPCAALGGQDVTTKIDTLFDAAQMTSIVSAAAFKAGIGALQNTDLPFTTHLELSGSVFSRGATNWEILSVQPLWQDTLGQHHIFTQLSWNRTTGRDGYASGNTLNSGLAYRRLSHDRSTLYGLNTFFDHALESNHNRMSIGADVQTGQLGAAVNRYIPLSDWKTVNNTIEERASAGWDVQLQGRLPAFPAWQLNLTGFQWSSNGNMQDKTTYGYDTTLQWQPVNGLQWEMGGRDEAGGSMQLHTNVRLVYKFGEPFEKMWARPHTLKDVSDRVYDKVQRENAIRITQRRKAVSAVTVVQTIGANTASESGAPPAALTNGQELQRPVTVIVSAVAGSLAQLSFTDGGTLTLGTGTTVEIEANLITLISGVLQYVSGATNINLAAPGATIVLLGTDVDLSTNGGVTVLRVRDGAAQMTGTASGSTLLNAGEAARANGGNVGGVLAEADASFVNHTNLASESIDRVMSVQTGAAFTPYVYEEATLFQSGSTVGDVIKISLAYSKPVNVTGTPQLSLRINGNDDTADYSAADSTTDELVFAYTLPAAAIGANSVTSKHIQLNGGTIRSGTQSAVTTMADTVLAFAGAINPAQDNTPDAFSFTAAADTAWNSVITSNTVTINGIGPAAVSVSIGGDGSPEFNINGSGWVSAPAVIADGQTLQLRLTSANTLSTLRTANVTVGTEAVQWNVTTIADQCQLASPAPGVVCADGSIFASFSPDGGHKMYARSVDQGNGPWSANGMVTSVQTFQTNVNTGRANTAALSIGGLYEDADSGRAGVQTHSAANGCASLVAHGRDDWYLPAYEELRVLYTHQVAIGGFAGGEYWSSTEVATTTARPLNLTTGGTTSFRSKPDFRRARCVRRDG